MNRRALVRPGRGLAAVSAACLVAVATGGGPAAAGTTTHARAPGGLPGPVAARASVPHTSDLSAVAATSARNAWAVGFRYNGTADQTLIEHWNGRAWREVASPDPGGSFPGSGNQLAGVAATSARNAWAVGSWTNGTTRRMLIEHWNGRLWKHVSVSFTGCLKDSDGLSAVTATSASNAWAVGTATSCVFGVKITVILHWDGHSWHQVTSPDPGAFTDNTLRGVSATSARDAWAVGIYTSSSGLSLPLVAHWDGHAWTQVASPTPYDESMGLLGVAARTPAKAWAVGEASTGSLGGTQQLTFHWNGTTWKQAPSSSQGGRGLGGVAVVPGTRQAWAVGFRVSSTSPLLTFIERWTGSSWQRVLSPNPGQGPAQARLNQLQGVTAVSASSAWAVGACSKGAALKALVEHWNGRAWRVAFLG